MHVLFQRWPKEVDVSAIEKDEKFLISLSEVLEIPIDDIDRLRTIWRGNFIPTLRLIQQKELSFSIRLLGGSLAQYMRATHEWFEDIKNTFPAVTIARCIMYQQYPQYRQYPDRVCITERK